jgi:putative ABC transport system substrate-binding protein
MKSNALLPRLLRTCLCLGLALGGAAQAQSPSPSRGAAPFTIVMVLPRAPQSTEAGFRDYLERESIAARYLEVRYEGKPDAAALRQRVAALQPDLVYSWGTPTTLALAGRHDQSDAANPLRNTPIVFAEVTDPVGSGLLKNPQQPERNVTGVSHVAPLDVLRNLKALAQRQGMEVIEASLGLDANQAPDPAQIAPLVADIAQRGADLLYIGPITFLAFTHRDAITQAALQNRLPTFCATESIVRRSGCLFGLFSNDTNVGRFAGSMARQILAEKKPVGAIAASTLQRFSLLVNLPTAQTLELYPPMLLLNVAEVIPATGAALGAAVARR